MNHLMRKEIYQQPDILERFIATRRSEAEKLGKRVRELAPGLMMLIARGSSDNAAVYGKYLIEYFTGIPCALAAPSIFTIYNRPLEMKGQVAVGISQSGEGTDIVETLEAAKKRGAFTIAVTNTRGSAITKTADIVLDLGAGKEKALAATKTYTAQLAAMMMIAAGVADKKEIFQEIQKVPGQVALALKREEDVRRLAGRYRFMTHCVVLGRGFNYATIREAALKMMETNYVAAQPFSMADFLHGPIALVDPNFPAFVAAPTGRMSGSMTQLVNSLVEKKADIMLVSDNKSLLKKAAAPVAMEPGIPEPFSPVSCIVPFQFMAYYIALAKGIDPDRPRFLSKVTRTR